MEEEKEIWKSVKGYDDYLVSNLGRLKNTKINRINTGCVNHSGYIAIKMTKDSKTKTFLLHRIVAKHFIDNSENKSDVNHLGEKTDNRVCMLEWATRKENCQHSVENKKYDWGKKVNQIDIETGEIIKTYNKIIHVKQDGFTDSSVSKCILGKKKQYKGYKWEYVDKPAEIIKYSDEEWQCLEYSIYDDVNIFPKYYVSNYGRVRGWFNRILKSNNCNDYYTIVLSNGEQHKVFKIHRLVLMAFNIPKPDGKTQVDHLDADIGNNHISNLRWADRKDQVETQRANKSYPKQNIKGRTKIKVTENGEETIYEGMCALSTKLGIKRKTINKYAKNGKEYKGYTFEKLI